MKSIRHDEAMIRHFADDPEFAELYISAAESDGDEREINIIRSWYEEAERRKAKLSLERERMPHVSTVMA